MGKKANKGPALPPAFQACDDDDVNELRDILNTDKAQMSKVNSDGWQPLHQASYAGALDCVKLLIQQGADIKALCKDGDTPLHYASAQSHLDVITALAKAGAPLELSDKDGQSPMDVAGSRATKKLLADLIKERETAGEDTGKGRVRRDGEDEDEDWEEVDEEELGEEEIAALSLEAGGGAGKKKKK